MRQTSLLLSLALLLPLALGQTIQTQTVPPIPATPQTTNTSPRTSFPATSSPATGPITPPTALPEIAPVSAPTPRPAPPRLQPIQPVPVAPSASLNPPTQGAAGRVPTDPLYPQQWDMAAIRVPQAWALLGGQAQTPVTVAVLDTGFILTPELGTRLVNGFDFVSSAARAGDGDGRDADARGSGPNAYHAEVVSNIIAAAHDAQGMAGINPQARVVAVRVAGVDGLIDPVDLIDGMRWAAGLSVPGTPVNRFPARVLNLSLYADFIPLTGCDPRIQKAVDEVTARGVLVVVGAGNDDADARGYSPAGCRNVLTVTSVDAGARRPAYANWGLNVNLAAHGGDSGQRLTLSSTLVPSGVMTPEGGTSLAAPHVTGVASLILSLRPKLSPAQVKNMLLLSASPFAGGRCDPDTRKTCGRGVLNAEAALKRALASNLGK
ncbi:S8 family serine peptidase [Deinococcus fonticola]|uniref:S8 family serine peptidase n=1 Tax=Deinococcus fonticola TaxID=2528713 RepID=UPI001F111D94|nr:S8 family serine peptidase [Deinococcus fonticola]